MTRLLQLIIVVCLSSASANAATPASFKGLPLAAALERLQQQGLRVVFSSDLVRGDMVVLAEPTGQWPREILDGLLAPHGLRPKQGPAGTWLVVRAPQRPPASKSSGPPAPTPMPGHFENVVVDGRESTQLNRNDARASFGRDALEAPTGHGDDPLSTLGRVAGVTTAIGGANLIVRGGADREAKIVLDGLDLPEPFHLKDHGGPLSLVDSNSVGHVELLNGAFPAEYGGHMSAIVQMDTLVPSLGARGEVAVASDGLRAATSGTYGDRASWVVSSRQGHGAPLLNALNAEPGYRPSYWDVFAKGDLRIGRKTNLSLHVLGGDDEAEGTSANDLIATVKQPGTFKSRYTNRYAWMTASHTFTPALFSQLMVSTGGFTIDRTGSSPRVASTHDGRVVRLVGIKSDWLWQSSRHFVKGGLDFKRATATYTYGALRLSPSGNDVGLYVTDRVRLSPRLSVEMGLRWDVQTYVQGNNDSLNPRINAALALTARTKVHAGWGRFAQSQKIHELQIEDGVTQFLPAERATHSVVSLDHEFAGGTQVQAAIYRKRMTALAPRFENLFGSISFFPEAEVDRVKLAPQAARADGLELSMRARPASRVDWWAAYGLARADDRIDDAWVARSWDERHSIGAGVAWRPTNAWLLAGAGSLHTGRPTTLVAGDHLGPRNALRLPAYSRLDVRLSRTIRLRTTALDAAVTVSNLFNTERAVDPILRQGMARLVTAGLVWKF